MDKQELKNCPFCGSDVAIKYEDDVYRVACLEGDACPIFVYTDTELEAVKVWNTRPKEDKLNARIRELEEGLMQDTLDVRCRAIGALLGVEKNITKETPELKIVYDTLYYIAYGKKQRK